MSLIEKLYTSFQESHLKYNILYATLKFQNYLILKEIYITVKFLANEYNKKINLIA